MDINKVVEPKEFEIGVIVARYQVDEIHEGQKRLIDYICSQHKKVILFLGVGRGQGVRANAMDFATRKMMVQTDYPDITILPQLDQKLDEVWSKNLDDQIALVYGQKSTLLYGSRNSFIPHYKGKHETTELAPTIEVSGTEIRKRIASEVVNNKSFRAGIIYKAYSEFPKVYPTVDVVATDGEGKILLARKPNEKLYRFIGGFVDPEDTSLEHSARREFSEECGNLALRSVKYILSSKVNDWRYNGTENGIMTSLFLGHRAWGRAEASDDIEEVKWFDASYFTKRSNIDRFIFEGHRDMMVSFIEMAYEEKLISNLGPFYKEIAEPIDPDVVVHDNTYKIK